MRFASPSLHCLAAAATDATMSSSRTSSRGRNPWRRGFSDRPSGDREAFVSGDSHFRSVRDVNYGMRQGEGGNSGNYGGFQRQPYRPRPSFYQPQPFRQRLSKPLDFRKWEFAKENSPSHCERFIILSYNILADYLAINHRHELYFHIPRHILDWEWRKRRIMIELGLWSADIMCFQEVDRFHDLEEELKLQGYSGIWKMRTGNPVDGCAIFWRTTRFKLLQEEFIEFNKLGLRDNIAQICVLESGNQNAAAGNGSAVLPTSSTGANKVVVCNIHVLYNPRRGEIKLGQVRVLLNRAYAVSKTWNDAPVVICGDFNCTPKSPLYKFISEQKLNLIGLDRDKVSGQSSAAIHAPKPYSSNPGQGVYRAQSADSPIRASKLVDEKEVGIKQSDFLSDMHEHNKPHSNSEIAPLIDNLSLHQSITSMLDTSDKSCSDGQYGNESSTISDAVTKETQQDVVDGCKDETSSSVCVPIDCLKGSPSNNHDESGFSADLVNDRIHEFTPPIDSRHEDIYSAVVESVCGEKVSSYTAHSIYGSYSEHSQSEVYTSNLVAATMQDGSVQDDADNERLDSDEGAPSFPANDYYTKATLDEKPVNAFVSDISSSELVSETLFPDGVEASPPTSLENCSSESIVSEEKANPLTPYESAYQVEISDGSTSIDLTVDQKVVHLSPNKLDEVMEKDGSLNEDYRTFLSELCNTEDVFLNEVNCGSQLVRPDSAEANQSSEQCATIPPYSQLHPPSAEVQDFSPLMDSDLADVEKNTYDPSLWTPMEIQTASGNGHCTLLEHPLKLRSTYADVKDYSGTRDANREPQVTSYNRRFLGTVDYIWCSKGLQTVKVLDTLPKHVLQWTSGFPTKKWGSDHIALASELAFMKDVDQS